VPHLSWNWHIISWWYDSHTGTYWDWYNACRYD